MDGNKIRDPLLATVPKEETIPAAVRRASGWAVFTAAGTLLSFAMGHAAAYTLGQYQVCSTQVGVFNPVHTLFLVRVRCDQWTDEQAAEDSALWFGMLSCALLQAAAAALALQLPCRRRRWVRRALAYLALVVTFVGHCMYAAAVPILLAADPGRYIISRIFCTGNMVIFAGGDLVCFLGLLLGGED